MKEYIVYYEFKGAYSIEATSAKQARQFVEDLNEKDPQELVNNLSPTIKIVCAEPR